MFQTMNFTQAEKKDPLDLELFRDNSPYKVTLNFDSEKSHNPGNRQYGGFDTSPILIQWFYFLAYNNFATDISTTWECRKLSVRQLSIGTLQFRSAVDRGMIRGLCTTAVQVFDITQWNLAEDSFGVNTRSNAQRFVIDR